MNQKVIQLLTEATIAAVEGDEITAMKRTAEALGEMSSSVVGKTKEVVTTTGKKVAKTTKQVAQQTNKVRRRRNMRITSEMWSQISERIGQGEKIADVARDFGISYQTVWGRLNKETKPFNQMDDLEMNALFG